MFKSAMLFGAISGTLLGVPLPEELPLIINQAQERDECPICLDAEAEDRYIKLPCKHSFHGNCLEQWKKTYEKKYNQKARCPYCNSAIKIPLLAMCGSCLIL
ncbi:MAG TPA: RING finger domain-containing protein [Candidatus Babeliaceae bacterium]|nr:RING finger domain-containing protein [Candidatus Babeliaceae bacterium]